MSLKDPGDDATLSAGPVGYGLISDLSLRDRISWTAKQKELFFELLAAKSKLRLPEISDRVGKSILECQAYLDILELSSRLHDPLSYLEHPIAYEIPDEYLEPEVPPSPQILDDEIYDNGGLIDGEALAELTGLLVTPELVDELESLVREKTRELIVSIPEIGSRDYNVSKRLDGLFGVDDRYAAMISSRLPELGLDTGPEFGTCLKAIIGSHDERVKSSKKRKRDDTRENTPVLITEPVIKKVYKSKEYVSSDDELSDNEANAQNIVVNPNFSVHSQPLRTHYEPLSVPSQSDRDASVPQEFADTITGVGMAPQSYAPDSERETISSEPSACLAVNSGAMSGSESESDHSVLARSQSAPSVIGRNIGSGFVSIPASPIEEQNTSDTGSDDQLPDAYARETEVLEKFDEALDSRYLSTLEGLT